MEKIKSNGIPYRSFADSPNLMSNGQSCNCRGHELVSIHAGGKMGHYELVSKQGYLIWGHVNWYQFMPPAIAEGMN